jgi:hypothetical protein
LPPRRKKGGGWRWLLALAVLAAAAWFWWHHEHPAKVIRAPVKALAPRLRPFVVVPESPAGFPRPVRDVFEAQVALARRAISPGSIDAALGSQTRAAISVFQEIQNLPRPALLDTNTRARLMLDAPLLTTYTVTTNDLARLQPLGKTWLAKSQQTALDYETELELVAEKSHSHPELIRRLNPGRELDEHCGRHGFENSRRGISNSRRTRRRSRSFICRGNFWRRLTRRRTCSRIFRAASRRTSRNGRSANCTWSSSRRTRITRSIRSCFPNRPRRRPSDHKLILPPGPNNPVGVAWIGLDKTGYGIHGTPAPEQVGRTESHGCFRLANWDAEYLYGWIGSCRCGRAVIGMPVVVRAVNPNHGAPIPKRRANYHCRLAGFGLIVVQIQQRKFMAIGIGLIIAIVLLVVVLGLVGFVIGVYNKLVTMRNRYKNAYAQIDVQLKRRYDLIPNLVETPRATSSTNARRWRTSPRRATSPTPPRRPPPPIPATPAP